ncbi:hypothetical protein [Embleya sp. NPDC050493]|uniref:hypothetical protein n=1 Tax=Embleya sp. NPDC050493 TaxID=3363989 RepID=UPI00379F27A4
MNTTPDDTAREPSTPPAELALDTVSSTALRVPAARHLLARCAPSAASPAPTSTPPRSA